MDKFLIVIQCLGVISFSISGTIVAIRKKMDFIGALIFALLTAFGGGLLRDLTLGITPPHILYDPEYFLFALIDIVVSVILFHLSLFEKVNAFITNHRHAFIIDLFDAIGLSLFCVFGVKLGIETVPGNVVLAIYCGLITGVGGGVLRDVCAAQIPVIFRKHVYFLPALLGSAFYALTCNIIYDELSMMISVVLIIAFRVLATIFKWNLPHPGKDDVPAQPVEHKT